MKTLNKVSTLGILIGAIMFSIAGLAIAAATAVDLGAADDFAVLAGSGITDTLPSVVSGDVGLSPTGGAAIGLTAGEVTGTIYDTDGAGPGVQDAALLILAKGALVTAYDAAVAQTPAVQVGDLGGQELTPGVYEDDNSPDSMAISSGDKILTLNGQGNPNAVFVFKSGSTLITAAGSEVKLINGAQACNVFWQVTSSATLGVGTKFKGNILALTSITDNGGSIIEGRLLARNGAVTLNDTTLAKATCVTPPPPPAPVSSTSGSSGSFAPLPLINVTKIPSPLALPGGAGPVTYMYTATNIGPVAMHGVWVRDNKCSPVTFVSGDSNDDSVLDLDESWTYSCTKTVSATETNTATAHGQANGWDAYDTANATVVVGSSLTPPLIHVVKKPNVFVLPAGGGAVTYSYAVTNPGIVPLHDVSIVDDKCTGLPGRVVGHPGDVNGNGLLDPGETFQFTCMTNLTQTTTNIGTAEGHANGFTTIDFSPATVVVAAPGLPNTGLAPESGSNQWNTILLAGILALALTTLGLVLRKRTI